MALGTGSGGPPMRHAGQRPEQLATQGRTDQRMSADWSLGSETLHQIGTDGD